jgi:hypothetical protein
LSISVPRDTPVFTIRVVTIKVFTIKVFTIKVFAFRVIVSIAENTVVCEQYTGGVNLGSGGKGLKPFNVVIFGEVFNFKDLTSRCRNWILK